MASPEEVQKQRDIVREHGPAWRIDLTDGQSASIRASALEVRNGDLIATKRRSTPTADKDEGLDTVVVGGWASGTWRSFHRIDNA